jgi:hypothetical protein
MFAIMEFCNVVTWGVSWCHTFSWTPNSAFCVIGIIQYRQCTYNVTLRRVRTINEKHKYYVFWVCSLCCAACNANAPYCHLWPAPFYNIFSNLSHKRHDFRKNVTEYKMCVVISSTNLVRNIFHSVKNLARYEQKCTSFFVQSTLYSCQIFMKLEFSRQFLKKILKCKISWKSV